MAKKEMNVSQWVDERLAALNSRNGWQPDAEQGLIRLRERRRQARRRTVEWIAASFAGVAACAALMIFASPGACARPNSCAGEPAHPSPASAPAPSTPTPSTPLPAPAPAAPVQAPVVQAAPPVKPPQRVANFKEVGSPNAPILCEIYTDYECPSCALLYKDSMPALMHDYVQTGKLRILHRDFPLPQHPYARLAARFANAAGSLGYYELVVNQIFQTQKLWQDNGNVDGQVMLVLPPGVMQQVRELVANDPHLDDSVAADMKMGISDHLDSTPTLVFVVGGKRQSLTGIPKMPILKTYLDQVLQGH